MNHWLIVTSPENVRTTREMGWTMHGLKSRHRKKAERMNPGDRMVLYATGVQALAATTTITSTYWEDHSPVWDSKKKGEDYPFRFHIKPEVVLDEDTYLPALQVVHRLEYVRKWPPEHWHLAFQGNVHLIPESDFMTIEEEMSRVASPKPVGAGPAAKS